MTQISPITATEEPGENHPLDGSEPASESDVKPSYVKLAMRNMVKKKAISLFHFSLTTAALLGFLIGLAYLTR